MRLSLRFLVPLAVVLGCIAYLVTPLADALLKQWAISDLDLRSRLIGSTVDDSLFAVIGSDNTITKKKVKTFFDRVMQDQRLFALGFCDDKDTLGFSTEKFPQSVSCPHSLEPEAQKRPSQIVSLPQGAVHVAYYPLASSGHVLGQLVLVHDMSFIENRSETTKRYIMLFMASVGAAVALVTILIAQLSWRGWVAGMRGLLRGGKLHRPLIPQNGRSELEPVASELRELLRDLGHGHHATDDSQVTWTPESIKKFLKREFVGDEVIVVSHREPYIHNYVDSKVTVRKPATGVITALEPVMRACSGTWVALGSGSADRETVDAHDHIAVPPEAPAYTLRRVWLSSEEEKAHHSLSTEGFYTLCLVAHVRPVFRHDYWKHYQEVNRKFADAVVSEAKTKDPVILVQDYHFALLPRLLRERLPQATIVSFWHIPWPNGESFSICPWAEEILDGMLGSSILGFHTKYHCHNFFETIDRFLECRIDTEQSIVSYRKSLTAVNAYPISIDFDAGAIGFSSDKAREELRHQFNIGQQVHIGIGVDRLDYTKGISEKFYAIERFLELYPDWVGKFSYVQIAAPTRAYFEEYKKSEEKMTAIAERVNTRFGKDGYKPIILVREYKNADALGILYRGSNFCFIGSLHDGMNLVAKEFVAARTDELGVLLLSQFTGATRELPEALIVNPYHTDQCAETIHRALTMDDDEQRQRMRAMRTSVREGNIYRWAGRILLDAARMRRRSRFLDQ